jgi:hypothetical protein
MHSGAPLRHFLIFIQSGPVSIIDFEPPLDLYIYIWDGATINNTGSPGPICGEDGGLFCV